MSSDRTDKTVTSAALDLDAIEAAALADDGWWSVPALALVAEVRSLRAKVAAVEARLDRLDKDVQSIASASDYGMGYQDGQSDERAYISREIRAALATGEGK